MTLVKAAVLFQEIPGCHVATLFKFPRFFCCALPAWHSEWATCLASKMADTWIQLCLSLTVAWWSSTIQRYRELVAYWFLRKCNSFTQYNATNPRCNLKAHWPTAIWSALTLTTHWVHDPSSICSGVVGVKVGLNWQLSPHELHQELFKVIPY